MTLQFGLVPEIIESCICKSRAVSNDQWGNCEVREKLQSIDRARFSLMTRPTKVRLVRESIIILKNW